MRKQYDFSKAKRAKNVAQLAKLQAEAKGKAGSEGTGYQTLINQTLRQAVGAAPVDEATLRRVLREELKAG